MASIKECSVVRTATRRRLFGKLRKPNERTARIFGQASDAQQQQCRNGFINTPKRASARIATANKTHTDPYILHWRRVRIQTVRGVIKNYGHKM